MARRQYLELTRARWPSLLAGLLLGLLVGVGVTVLMPPKYSAAATIFVSARSPNGDLADAVEGGDLSAQRMATYIEVLRSDRLAAEVATRLGDGVSADEVSDKITASSTPDTLFLTATVVDQSPQRAADIANLVADGFIDNVAELEAPDLATAPFVTARTFQRAVPPTSPTEPRPVLNIALGLVLGLIAGIGLALLRNAFDQSIRSRDQLRRALDAPVLGMIGADNDLPKHPLAFRERRRSRVAEAYRYLRTNLQFVDVNDDHRVILVASAGPGEGRTTTVCNLALAMAAAGRRVLVIEADLRHPRAADLFGVERTVGLTNILAGRTEWMTAVQRWKNLLDVLPSGPLPQNPGELLSLPTMARLLADVRAEYDVVIIDSPPLGPVSDALVLAPLVDGVVLVVRWGKTTTSAVEDAAESLDVVSARLLGSVMTMIRRRRLRRHVGHDEYLVSGVGAEYTDQPWPVATPDSISPEPAGPDGSTPSPAPAIQAPRAAVLAGSTRWPPSPRPRPRPSRAGSSEERGE
jgi:capsular exopolysaccharide synthesis family protein